MKCPMRIFVVQQGLEVGTGYMPDCLKEQCAWWDQAGNSCAVLSIYQELRLLVGACAPIAGLVRPARK